MPLMAKLKFRRQSTRRYETVYIFDSALDDALIAEKLEKFHALLDLAEPATNEHWGRRALAYKIGRHDNGYYVISHFTTAPKQLPEFERALKLDDGVVRYLVSLFEHELGAPKLTEEQLAARRRDDDDDDDED
jgi:small subunit ribosomal protein S6